MERLKNLLRPAYYFARSVAHGLLAPLHVVHSWLAARFGGEIFLLLGVHAVAGAIWVGGMFFALLILRPVMRGTGGIDAAARVALHRGVLRRFLPVVWVAMPVMLISGARMIETGYGKFAWAPWPVQAMAFIGVAMGGVFLAIWFGPYRRLRAADATAGAAAAIRAITWLMALNLALGLLAMMFGGMD